MQVVLQVAAEADFADIRSVVASAFAREDEARFLEGLRSDPCLICTWLARDSGGVVGCIAFSRVWIDRDDEARIAAALLAPLAVRADRQREGIGSRLVSHALGALEDIGEHTFLVVGHPVFYGRFGFRTVRNGEIASPWTGKPAFMVRSSRAPCGRLVLPAVIANAP